MTPFKTRGALLFGTLLFLLAPPSFGRDFDGKRAYARLQEQCGLGTREPGSAGHAAMKRYLETFLKAQKGRLTRQDFTFTDKKRGKKLDLTNFILLFPGPGGKRILLCAHWDTRPWADRERDPRLRTMPVPGANDGASGTAVLMELCRLLSDKPPPVSVEIVFFDGEDYGQDRDEYWCQGSKHFAERARPADYAFAVLLDMVGDRDLTIKKEGNSLQRNPMLVDRLWRAASRLSLPAFLPEEGPFIYDDHIPLLEKGIPSVDLIDFDYPYWHTTADTPDKCSAASLSQTGRLLMDLIYGNGE